MLSIDENELRELLESKKTYIERPVLVGIGEFISGISLFITLCTSQFDNIPIVSTSWFKLLMFVISIGTILTSFGNIIKGAISRQTIQNLLENIQELDTQKVHVVNIMLFKNTPEKGKYLLVKNKDWKCNLFPSYNSSLSNYDIQSEITKIEGLFAQILETNDVTVKYMKQMDAHIKLCVGARVRWRYVFHFYQVQSNTSNARMKRGFMYDGHKYTWKSLDQMHRSKNIMKKNGDVVRFVAELDHVPYN